jgi:pSer/pThr/pTyr-binding forkhead associated (FHA) protein
VKDDQGYLLRDVGSLNGTYVNRERVDEARLHHGDEVQIGRYRLSFVLGQTVEA